jgi:hypothetical protein
MKSFVLTLALMILTRAPALAQESTFTDAVFASAPLFPSAVGERVGFQSQDNGATSTDQAAKSTEPKGGGTVLIGCLSGPDGDGKFTLRSMSHRTGVEVFGPENLKDDSGSKVKLTGSWKPSDQPTGTGKESRKFQATEIEVMAEKCEVPSEKTPVSKTKQQKQQQKQKSSASAPAGGDTTPKQ